MAQTTIKPERRQDLAAYVLIMLFIGLASAALVLDDGGIRRTWNYASSLMVKNESGLPPAAVKPRQPAPPKSHTRPAAGKHLSKLETAP